MAVQMRSPHPVSSLFSDNPSWLSVDSVILSSTLREGFSVSCRSALSRLINKAADGGITALHMAAVNGHFDCVQLLLDLHASISAVTFHYGTAVSLIGIILQCHVAFSPPIAWIIYAQG